MENQKKSTGKVIGIIAGAVLVIVSVVLFLVSLFNISGTIEKEMADFRHNMQEIQRDSEGINNDLDKIEEAIIGEDVRVSVSEIAFGLTTTGYTTVNNCRVIMNDAKDYVIITDQNNIKKYIVPLASILYIEY